MVLKDFNDTSKGYQYVNGPVVELTQGGLSVIDSSNKQGVVDFDSIYLQEPALRLWGNKEDLAQRLNSPPKMGRT